LATSASFELAILDINVKSESIPPVARILATKWPPLVFASGYATTELPEPFHDRTILQKPFVVKRRDLVIRGVVR